MLGFRPVRVPVWGRVALAVELANLHPKLALEDVALELPGVGNASCAAVSYGGGKAPDRLVFRLPTAPALAPRALAPRLLFSAAACASADKDAADKDAADKECPPLPLGGEFEYAAAPVPAVLSVTPAAAPVRAAAAVQVLVADMPGALDPAELGVQLQLADGRTVAVAVDAVRQQDPAREAGAVQTLAVDFRTPAESGGGGGGSLEGAALVRVVHRTLGAVAQAP